MSFESLSHRYTHVIPTFPERWLPLIHLYDADLPLFPIQYFHICTPNFPSDQNLGIEDRLFGYLEKINLTDSGLEVSIICNKDLKNSSNSEFLRLTVSEIEGRIGVSNPVLLQDISTSFHHPFIHVNAILIEIWRRVISNSLGDSLPFGRFFDRVFGLARFVASFYSPSGRKSEWIQTHYFLSKFGEKIKIGKNLPQMDFYLLPTFEEIIDPHNPPALFPKFKALIDAAQDFHKKFCTVECIGDGLNFSKFNAPFTKGLNTDKLKKCIHSLNPHSVGPLTECFNAFDKGPLRTIMFLQMLNDLIAERLIPDRLRSKDFGLIYDKLARDTIKKKMELKKRIKPRVPITDHIGELIKCQIISLCG